MTNAHTWGGSYQTAKKNGKIIYGKCSKHKVAKKYDTQRLGEDY